MSASRSFKVTLRLTVSQSISPGVEPYVGLMTRYLLLIDSYGVAFLGRPLWREDGSVFCIWCWFSPAQSFFVQSPLRLVTIFYCLKLSHIWDFPFRLLLRLAGSRWRYSNPPPHGCIITFLRSRSHIATILYLLDVPNRRHQVEQFIPPLLRNRPLSCCHWDILHDWQREQLTVKVTLRLTVSQSVSLSVEPHLGLMTRNLLLFDSYGLVFLGRPLWREDGSEFMYAAGPRQRSPSRVWVP
jgi:hypothetical protein